MSGRLKIKRDELRKFARDERTLRQLEKLFTSVQDVDSDAIYAAIAAVDAKAEAAQSRSKCNQVLLWLSM